MTAKMRLKISKSAKLFSQALDVMPGGATSNARLWQTAQFCPIYTPCTIFAKRAYGSHIWDVDGNKYIDYRLGFGPIILGHSYPSVRNAIHAAEKRGTVYALDNELELNVAKKIIDMVPSAQMVRFSVTGTEATMHAIRLARAYTKKNVILKFEGHYHGNHDYVLFSTSPPYNTKIRPYPESLGIPPGIEKLVIVETFNNFESIERTVKARHRHIAAIILEPIMGNAAAIMPKPGYLKFLRELCDRYDILLIFDEVKTGFRVSRGGAQELYKVKPDITTLGKSMSNGYPVSAIAGQREIMEFFGPGVHHVTHGGTYAGNPHVLTAAEATLDVLKDRRIYTRLSRYGTRLMGGIRETLEDTGIKAIVQGHPNMFQYVLTNNRTEINNYRELKTNYGIDMYSKIQYWLLTQGVMLDEDSQECWYTCLSHSLDEDLEETLNAFRIAVERSKNSKFRTSRFKLETDRATKQVKA